MVGRSCITISTVEPIVMASPGKIAAGSLGLMTVSRTRVPLALPTSSIVSTGTPPSEPTWMRACSREAMASSIRTSQFLERPTVTTPEAGSGCDQNTSSDMTSR